MMPRAAFRGDTWHFSTGRLAERVTVLQAGRVLVEGAYAQVRADHRVIAAYLGDAGPASHDRGSRHAAR